MKYIIFLFHASLAVRWDYESSRQRFKTRQPTNYINNTTRTAAISSKTGAFKSAGLFGLKNGLGQYCFLADFQGRIVMETLGGKTLKKAISYVDPSSSDAILTGRCEKEKIILNVSWEITEVWQMHGEATVSMTFAKFEYDNPVKKIGEDWWKLQDAKFVFQALDERAPKDFVARLVKEEKSRPHAKAPTGINARVIQALFCKHSLDFTLANNETKTRLSFQFKNFFSIEPMFTAKNSLVFGTKFLCLKSRNIKLLGQLRNTSTIISGCVLGVVIIAVMMGYSVKRQFYPGPETYQAVA